MPQRSDAIDPLGVVRELVSRTNAAADGIQGVCKDIVRLLERLGVPGDDGMARDSIADSADFLHYMLDVPPVFAVELVEATDDPIIIKASRALEEMFGYAPGQLIGLAISALIPPDKRIAHKGWIVEFLKHPVDRQMGNLGNIEPEGIDITGKRFPIVLMWKRFYLEKRQFLAATVMQQVRRAVKTGESDVVDLTS
jgi:PAS domain S-box-containing protein